MYTHSTKSNILIFWSIWILLTVKYFKQVKYKSASDIDHPRKLKKYNIHSKQISRQSHLNFPQNSKDDMCMLPWYLFKDLLSAAMIHVFGSFYQLKMFRKKCAKRWRNYVPNFAKTGNNQTKKTKMLQTTWHTYTADPHLVLWDN